MDLQIRLIPVILHRRLCMRWKVIARGSVMQIIIKMEILASRAAVYLLQKQGQILKM